MEFVWDMTEDGWRGLVAGAHSADYCGNCRIGYLCVEFINPGYIIADNTEVEALHPFVNIYALGIDDGYGETRVGKTPYALLDDDIAVPTECETFSEFKQKVESRLTEKILNKKSLTELANKPLGNWA